METLVVDVAQLDNSRNSIVNEIENLKQETDIMIRSIAELNNMWDGSAHDAFLAAFQEDTDWLMGKIQSFEQFARLIGKAKEDYNRLDETMETVVSRIIL